MESHTNTNTNSPDSSVRDFAFDFGATYGSIFLPKCTLPNSLSLTPSTTRSSLSDSDSDDHNRRNTTLHRLNQAHVVLEYQELRDHYHLCNAHLRHLTNELHSLRRENAHLRSANTDLVKLLSSQAAFQTFLLSSSSSSSAYQTDPTTSFADDFVSDEASDISPTSVMLRNTISVRPSIRQRVPSQAGFLPLTHSQMKVFNQGMLKTELCNKWEETGTCPYRNNCQFAHGVSELRPVMRHSRYKTQLCRMVLAGVTCPYGRRCHFRHSLTEQERLHIAKPDSF